MKKYSISDLGYVELYAKKMKVDNSYFKQQKILIESQIKASSIIFRNKFGRGEMFKNNARKYLRLTKNL